jgi:hypothetical protein
MAPKKPEFEPRRAEPGQEFTFNDAEGTLELRADDQGVVHPKDAREVLALDAFDLPVARKVLAEQKAAESADNGDDAGKEG